VLPLPDAGRENGYSLVQAISIFTHMVEHQTAHYLHELRRVMRPDGVAVTTWVVFDQTDFPMMQEFQNALFINDVDPTNAVIFDREWLRTRPRRPG